jgi:hypothetical protein
VPVNRALQNSEKRILGATRGIQGPAHVVEVVLEAGRTWRTVESSDGVVSQVGMLRQRALQTNGGGR